MVKILIVLILVLGIFTNCEKKDRKLTIYISNWIGYTPLLYLKHSGKLDNLNIELSSTKSLEESLVKYKKNPKNSLLCGTQYEFKEINKLTHNFSTINLFNRSYGGDLVLSNRTLYDLSKTDKTIDVYMETNSINSLVFDDFKKINSLDNHEFNIINFNQDSFKDFKLKQNPSIIITYSPYDKELVKNGYIELDSTKSLNIFVIDGLFIDKSLFNQNQKRLKELSRLIKEAIVMIKVDPLNYYNTIKSDFDNITYEEFIEEQSDIYFISNNMSNNFYKRLEQTNIEILEMGK